MFFVLVTACKPSSSNHTFYLDAAIATVAKAKKKNESFKSENKITALRDS